MKKDLVHIIKQGENEGLEFKTSFGKETIESVVAFANTKGGQIIIGITNNKAIIGVGISEESIPNWINQIKQNTHPQVIPNVEHFVIEGKNVIVFTVPEYPVKPVAFKNKYLKRVKNSNHLMSVDEIANEHLKTINSSWDFYQDTNHSINDISEAKGLLRNKSGNLGTIFCAQMRQKTQA
ncbi:MAG: putative DNA binding domain-containing protein [Draconibacterium sp.]|nr:putative DNA binding domain-containing protein [Draconibacterium sp.]